MTGAVCKTIIRKWNYNELKNDATDYPTRVDFEEIRVCVTEFKKFSSVRKKGNVVAVLSIRNKNMFVASNVVVLSFAMNDKLSYFVTIIAQRSQLLKRACIRKYGFVSLEAWKTRQGSMTPLFILGIHLHYRC